MAACRIDAGRRRVKLNALRNGFPNRDFNVYRLSKYPRSWETVFGRHVENVLVGNRLRKRRINLGSFGSKKSENCSSFCKSVKLSGSRNSTHNFFWKHAYGQEKEKLGGVAQTACESIDFPWRFRGGRGGSTAVNVVASSPPRARRATARAR